MRGTAKLTDEVRGTGPLKNGRLLSGERTPCTSTWQPPAPSAAARRWWSPTRTTFEGKDHAINCGVCRRRVIAAGLTGRGLEWHGSIDPEVWGSKLWDFASEGVDSVTLAGGDRRREESQSCRRSRCGPLRPGRLPAVWPRGESRTDDPRPGAGAGVRRLS